jgi:DNA N-6-adenine-methyltransferase (Dam)
MDDLTLSKSGQLHIAQDLRPGPTTALVLYETARRALAEAHSVDEVKGIRDMAAALEACAKIAKNTEMIRQATEIRFRAERRAGELLREMPKNEGVRSQLRGDVPVGGSAPQPPTDETPTLAALGVTKTQSSKWQRLAALPEDKFQIRVEHAKARAEWATTSAPSFFRQKYTGENEWFTPAVWIERARRALGGIDLDPASAVLAQQTVQAKHFFTAADDGLTQPWAGRVWLNPPYAKGLVEAFIDKLISEVGSDRVTAAVALTHNYSDTDWWHAALRAASSICHLRGRVHFVAPGGEECNPFQGHPTRRGSTQSLASSTRS